MTCQIPDTVEYRDVDFKLLAHIGGGLYDPAEFIPWQEQEVKLSCLTRGRLLRFAVQDGQLFEVKLREEARRFPTELDYENWQTWPQCEMDQVKLRHISAPVTAMITKPDPNNTRGDQS